MESEMSLMQGLQRTPRAQAAENARMALRALTSAPNSKSVSAAMMRISTALNLINQVHEEASERAESELRDAVELLNRVRLTATDLIPHPAVLAKAEVVNAIRYLKAI